MQNITCHGLPGEHGSKVVDPVVNISLAKQIYVALKEVDGPVPHGRVVLNTGDWRFKQGMKLADDWALPDRNRVWLDSVMLENEPISGFKIWIANDQQAAGKSMTNAVAMIIDPRGFEVEISFAGLSELLRSTVVYRGDILGSCVWSAKDNDVCLMSHG